MLLLNKPVKTVQYPTCISFIENKNKNIDKNYRMIIYREKQFEN